MGDLTPLVSVTAGGATVLIGGGRWLAILSNVLRFCGAGTEAGVTSAGVSRGVGRELVQMS